MKTTMLEEAEWSDKFFNGDWSPSLNLDQFLDDDASDYLVSEAAREFLLLFPSCPFNEDWLVKNYLRRV